MSLVLLARDRLARQKRAITTARNALRADGARRRSSSRRFAPRGVVGSTEPAFSHRSFIMPLVRRAHSTDSDALKCIEMAGGQQLDR